MSTHTETQVSLELKFIPVFRIRTGHYTNIGYYNVFIKSVVYPV